VKSAKTVNPLSIEISDQQTKIMGNIVDLLSNIANLKFFPNRNFEENRTADFENVYTKSYQKRGFFLLKFYLVQGFTFSAYFAFCIIALIWLYSKNLVTLGDFMMVFTINCFAIQLMWNAANEVRTFLEDFGTVKQALDIVSKPLEIKDGEHVLKVTKGEIIFENVEFGYKNSVPLFSGKNVVIKPGQKVGLVGRSGGGKSTFVNLILRLFDVEKGRILIDGQDISLATQDSLRTSIGVIPQDPSLFHRSLAENISYGKNGATELEVVESAKNAHAHDFIMHLPKNYESLVGERGIKLSGGQRQRIAIARAFLKNAPILILDEATSQLDSITENFIQDSLQKLMENKTVIVVAHRLSTLEAMDRILVFESGKIVEDGSHQELIALNGSYKKLWNAQNGGVLTNQVEDAEASLIWDFSKN
jgi:ATP-binding cassette subfamily B protein